MVGRRIERARREDLLAFVAERVDGADPRRLGDAVDEMVVVVAGRVASPPLHRFLAHDVTGPLVDVEPLVTSAGGVDFDDVGVELDRLADQPHVVVVAGVAERVVAERIAQFVQAGKGVGDPVAVLFPVDAVQDAALVRERSERGRLPDVVPEPVDLVRPDGSVLKEPPVLENRRRARVFVCVRSFVQRPHASERRARRDDAARLVVDGRQDGRARDEERGGENGSPPRRAR